MVAYNFQARFAPDVAAGRKLQTIRAEGRFAEARFLMPPAAPDREAGMSKADRYISKGGRTLGYGRDEFAADLHTAVTFMCWAQDDGAYYAGHTAQEAFKSMCRMLDIDSVKLRKIAMGEVE